MQSILDLRLVIGQEDGDDFKLVVIFAFVIVLVNVV